MKQYKVIALYVGGMSNKIFESGDIVNEDAFPEGHAEELVASEHLEPYTPAEVEVPVEVVPPVSEPEKEEEVAPIIPPVTEPVKEEEPVAPVVPPVTEPVKEVVPAPKKPGAKK